MKSNKLFLFLALVACISLGSCSGVPKGAGGGGGGGNTANVSLIMVSDTLPANLGLVSFVVTVNAIELTSSTGAQTTLALNGGKGITVDLVRLQSDSAFLGTIPDVPTGTNSSITLSFAPTVKLTFFNGTGSSITSLTPNCLANQVCTVAFTVVGAPVITASQAISGNTGIGIDFNLANSLTVSGGKLSVNLSNSGNTNVVSAFALPRTNSNLAAGQLDLIEDFTGVVTLGSPGVTIASATADGRGSIAASTATGTNYDPDPTGALCPSPTTQLSSCVNTNGSASMDAILNSNGSFTVQEIEPLSKTLQETVEGTVVAITSAIQFEIIATDIIPASAPDISSLSLGDPLTVNLSAGPHFYVDTKGLQVATLAPTSYNTFFGQTDTTALHLGQTVAVHITSFTPAVPNTTIASSQSDTVTLRWSRFIAPPTGVSTPSFLDVNSLPGYFNFTQASIFGVQMFTTGTPGADGVTNLDGISFGSSPAATPSVGIRALYLEDPGNTLTTAFFAAKVRQH